MKRAIAVPRETASVFTESTHLSKLSLIFAPGNPRQYWGACECGIRRTENGERGEREIDENRTSGTLIHIRTKSRSRANTGAPGRRKNGQSDVWPLVSGGEEEDRTPDLCIANAALSQLSYFPEGAAVYQILRPYSRLTSISAHLEMP